MSDVDERAKALRERPWAVIDTADPDFPVADAQAICAALVEELGITSEMVDLIRMEAAEARTCGG
jgi:hypothetical protein